ncbi:hypothetical protein ACFL0U_03685 [Pseudomonadota bacterium]
MDFITTKFYKSQIDIEIDWMLHWAKLREYSEIVDNKFILKMPADFINIQDVWTPRMTCESIAHELAHAVKIALSLDLENNGFLDVALTDLKQEARHINLKKAIKYTMEDEISMFKSAVLSKKMQKYLRSHTSTMYDELGKKRCISELFAQYFILIAMTKEGGWFNLEYPFTMLEVENYFTETNKWIREYLNPRLSEFSDEGVIFSSNKFLNELESLGTRVGYETKNIILEGDTKDKTKTFLERYEDEIFGKNKIIGQDRRDLVEDLSDLRRLITEQEEIEK